MTQAFVYHWQELSTNKWYIGSRTRKGCHPNDGYICSSKIVHPLIEANPADWKRTIIAVGEPKDIFNFEITLLQTLNAKDDLMSYNQTNGNIKYSMVGKKFSNEYRKKLSESHKGQKCPEWKKEKQKKLVGEKNSFYGKKHSKETIEHFSKIRKGRQSPNKGKTFTDEHCSKLSEAKKGNKNPKYWLGKPRSEETKRKISEAKKRKQQL